MSYNRPKDSGELVGVYKVWMLGGVGTIGCSPVIINEFIIFNTKFLVFDTNILVFGTKFIIFPRL